jgi:hypothetical protein
MILEPKRKNFAGPLQIKEKVKKGLTSGAIYLHEELLNAITLRYF